VDKASFPSDTISTHIVLTGGARVLSRMGAMDRLERSGGVRYARMRTLGPGFDYCAELKSFDEDLRGLCLGRMKMDSEMINLARDIQGVEIREGFRVIDLVIHGQSVAGIRGEDNSGQHEFRAPLIIGADGMRSTVAKIAEQRIGGFKREDVPCARAYYYAYFEGVDRSLLGDDLIVEFGPSGGGNLACRCEDGRVVAAVAFDANEMHSFRTDLAANLNRYLAGSSSLSKMLAGAVMIDRARSSGFLLNTYRVPVADGALLLGDAGLHVDPFFGQGHSLALMSAEIAAELTPSWLGARSGETIGAEVMSEFVRRRDEILMPHYRATVRVSSNIALNRATICAHRAASREQWAADEMVRFAQMAPPNTFPSLRFARLMAREARAE